MNKTITPIIAECNKCGSAFDIRYDIENMDEERLMFELLKSIHNPRTLLCWKCRQRY